MSKNIAARLLFGYLENWGRPFKDRQGPINDAFAFIGIKVESYVDERGYQQFRGSEEDIRVAREFDYAITQVGYSEFEKDVSKMETIMKEFRAMQAKKQSVT